jgi:hypothetical protein
MGFLVAPHGPTKSALDMTLDWALSVSQSQMLITAKETSGLLNYLVATKPYQKPRQLRKVGLAQTL